MKKIIKNILLAFVTIYTVLNVVLYGINIISKNKMTIEIAKEVYSYNQAYEEGRENEGNMNLELEKEYIHEMQEVYGENVSIIKVLGYQNYLLGMCRILDGQSAILISTLILSISIGIIISLTEKSKVKELLDFIATGGILVLACTIIRYIRGEYSEFKIFEEIIDIISSFGIYYIVAYLGKIVYAYCKNKKNVKELNRELENKNK